MLGWWIVAVVICIPVEARVAVHVFEYLFATGERDERVLTMAMLLSSVLVAYVVIFVVLGIGVLIAPAFGR